MNILAVTACSKYYDVVKEANFCNAVLNNLTIALCFGKILAMDSLGHSFTMSVYL